MVPFFPSRNGLARPNFQAVSDVQIRLGENSHEDGVSGVSGVAGHPGDDFVRRRWGRLSGKSHGKIHDEVSTGR